MTVRQIHVQQTWFDAQPLVEGQKTKDQTEIQVPGLVRRWELAQAVRKEHIQGEAEPYKDS